MRKIHYILAIMCCLEANAQISFVVQNMSIRLYNIKVSENHYSTEYGNGPLLGVKCIIKNCSFDTIQLDFDKCRIFFIFKYQGRELLSEASAFALQEKKPVALLPNDSVEISVGKYFIMSIPGIYNSRKFDYTKEMLEILPSIRVLYRQKDMKLYTTEIQSVTVSEE
ncbi:MAG: hypothetical protein LBV75_06710 [Paludibacter sp.]|jgi:hypothetical protein|nr:hypothetical protein [Paludibacter sp.]